MATGVGRIRPPVGAPVHMSERGDWRNLEGGLTALSSSALVSVCCASIEAA